MAKKAVILLADGFEEVEAITPVDYLRRAGIEVTAVSISDSLTVSGRWTGIKLIADMTMADLNKNGIDGYDAVIIPGGMPGASNLAASAETGALLKEMAASGKVIAAICASPAVVLSPLGIIKGKSFTCYPGMEEKVSDAKWSDASVVKDGNIITSRAAGTAGEWAMAIIETLLDKAAAKKIKETVLL